MIALVSVVGVVSAFLGVKLFREIRAYQKTENELSKLRKARK